MPSTDLRESAKTFLQRFRRALVSLRAYAPDHPMPVELVKQAATALFDFNAAHGDMLILEARGRLVVNDAHIERDPMVSEKLGDDLSRAGITSLKLSHGLSLSQFGRLCELLAHPERRLEGMDGLARTLASEGITSVTVNDLRVIAAGEPLGAAGGLAGLPLTGLDREGFVRFLLGSLTAPSGAGSGELQELPARFAANAASAALMLSDAASRGEAGEGGWLEALLGSLRRIGAPAIDAGKMNSDDFARAVAPVVTHLPFQDQQRLRSALRVPEGMEADEAYQGILARLYDLMIEERLERLCREHPEAEQTATAAAHLLTLSRDPERICGRVRSRLADLPPALAALTQAQGATQWQDLSPEGRALMLMQGDSLWRVPADRLVKELEDLLAASADEAVRNLFDKFLGGLSASTAETRTMVAAKLARVYTPLLRCERLEGYCRAVNDRIAARLRQRDNADVLVPLTRAAVDLIRMDLDGDRLVQTVPLLVAIARIPAEIADPLGRQLREERDRLCTRSELEQLVARTVAQRLELPSAPLALLKALPERAAKVIAGRLANEQDRVRRGRLAELLRQLGEHAVDPLRESLADERWFVVRNAARVLGDLKAASAVPDLGRCLNNPEPRVRKAVLRALSTIQSPPALAALLEAAREDPDEELRAEAKRLLGQHV